MTTLQTRIAALILSLTTLGQAQQPNVILILADDLGIGNFSCYGSDQFKTPNIDKLARNGVRFQQFYSTPLCGPSRACLLTGRYPFRTGAINNKKSAEMDPEKESMLSNQLQHVGYKTLAAGKWHQLSLLPDDWGFNGYISFIGKSGAYWERHQATYLIDGNEHRNIGYFPDKLNSFIKQWISDHQDEPFFIYYPMIHAHLEITRTPDSVGNKPDRFMDNILYMDKLVGNLVQTLEDQKLTEKTVIIFLTDNGTDPNYSARSTIEGKQLYGHKRQTNEGGCRTPLIISWPGTISPSVTNNLADISDILPTILDLTGTPAPSDRIIDGKSLAGSLFPQSATQIRKWIYSQAYNFYFIRNQNYKLDHSGLLYDMSEAPFDEKLIPQGHENFEQLQNRNALFQTLSDLRNTR